MRPRSDALECHLLSARWVGPLLRFLRSLEEAGEERFFSPHPFTERHVAALARRTGKDLHYVLTVGGTVVGYGLLRGWDEGYEVPSLGIAVHPSARGRGLGRALMIFLHAAAAMKGASRVRLRVSPDNLTAIALYSSLGYTFAVEEDGLRVGIIDLKRK